MKQFETVYGLESVNCLKQFYIYKANTYLIHTLTVTYI